MSFEALWYSAFDPEGHAPLCKRFSRLPMSQQFDLTIDLAIAFASGIAGYRKVWILRTGEIYWHWPHDLSASGWWLMPSRIEKRVFELERLAARQAMLMHHGHASNRQIVGVLNRWRLTGVWRRHVTSIVPRHGEQRAPTKKEQRAVARRIEIAAKIASIRKSLAAAAAPSANPEEEWQ
jgi:hypothetical protein